jgi:hypothetical protein
VILFPVLSSIMKRKLKIKPIYECRCNGRLQTKRFIWKIHRSSLVLLKGSFKNPRYCSLGFLEDFEKRPSGRIQDNAWGTVRRIGMFMNECIDSTMGRNPRMLAVLLASDDPRTSWSFQLVQRSFLLHWVHSQVERSLLIVCA